MNKVIITITLLVVITFSMSCNLLIPIGVTPLNEDQKTILNTMYGVRFSEEIQEHIEFLDFPSQLKGTYLDSLKDKSAGAYDPLSDRILINSHEGIPNDINMTIIHECFHYYQFHKIGAPLDISGDSEHYTVTEDKVMGALRSDNRMPLETEARMVEVMYGYNYYGETTFSAQQDSMTAYNFKFLHIKNKDYTLTSRGLNK